MMNKHNDCNTDCWKELKDHEIVAILDGDAELKELDINSKMLSLKMPHLTAKNIVYDIGYDHFHYYIPLYDDNHKTRSRWQLFFDLIDKSMEKNQTKEVLQYIFDKQNFRSYIEKDLGEDISVCRKLIPQIQESAFARINDVLYTKDLKMTSQCEIVPLDDKSDSNSCDHPNDGTVSKKKTGFYILPFEGDPKDCMLAIQTALENEHVNVDLVKAGDVFDKQYNTNIIDEIKDKIKNADVIIADLSKKNPNVYFELGLAAALNKNNIITICRTKDYKDEKVYNGHLPLDISINRTIFYEIGFESERKTAQKVVKEINSILTNEPVKVE